ncbi:MAG: phage tail spike protein [Clostridium baratii]|nr:phage tail spike protein [Clostridium baratii]
MNQFLILDDSLSVIGIISNDLPNALCLVDDLQSESLDSFTDILELSVDGNDERSEILEGGKFILTSYDGKYKLYKITGIEDSKSNINIKKVRCELKAHNDLLKGLVKSTKFTNADVEEVVNHILQDTEWSLGNVEDLGVRNIEFKYPTKLQGLYDTMQEYGGELEFEYVVEGTRIVKQLVHIYKKRGNQSVGDIFINGLNIKDINRDIDYSKICTAMIGVGSNGVSFENPPYLDVPEGYSWLKGTNYIVSDKAYQLYSETGEHYWGVNEDSKAQSAQELFDSTLAKLKEYEAPLYTYKISVEVLNNFISDTLALGDEIMITDKALRPSLYLKARVRKIQRSYTNPNKCEIEIGDYIPVQPSNNEKIQELQDIIKEQEEKLNASLWKVQIVSSAGTVFKNGQGETTLTARVYKGTEEIDPSGTMFSYTWKKLDKNGNSIATYGRQGRLFEGKSIRVLALDFDSTAQYVVEVEIPNV